jgi:RNA polymerase sigma-70 factor (ECF subfamily)
MHDLNSPGAAIEQGTGTDDATLVRRAKASDQLAFREIVERYQGRVFALICRILRDRTEAEDIAQEVFASAFFAIGSFQYQGTLLGWLYRISVNQCFQYLRKKKARPLVYESGLTAKNMRLIEKSASGGPPPPGIDAKLAQREFVLELLGRISREERCLLIMKEVEGYSVHEMTRITGISETSIKVKLFRARKRLLKAAGKPLADRASAEAEDSDDAGCTVAR